MACEQKKKQRRKRRHCFFHFHAMEKDLIDNNGHLPGSSAGGECAEQLAACKSEERPFKKAQLFQKIFFFHAQ